MATPASILAPTLTAYEDSFKTNALDKIVEFYHADGVVINGGKQAVHGRENILTFIKEFLEMTGKNEPTFSEQKYESSDNYIIYSAVYVSETEKMGTMKGKFTQIWKKEGEKWLIIYDIFESL